MTLLLLVAALGLGYGLWCARADIERLEAELAATRDAQQRCVGQVTTCTSSLEAAEASARVTEIAAKEATAAVGKLLETTRMQASGGGAASEGTAKALARAETAVAAVAASTAPRPSPETIPLLVMACARPQYLTRTLTTLTGLVAAHPSPARFPIYVSRDCLQHPQAGDVDAVLAQFPAVKELRWPRPKLAAKGGENIKYYYIAQHFGWALDTMFTERGFRQVVVLEEDLELAVDALDYFAAALPVLRGDPTLFCVSAYNDNGQEPLVSDPHRVLRTDMFPGLGWMLTDTLWGELGGERWAKGYWDDWLREPAQRKGRACLRPEISRSKTFGEIGTSVGQFYATHLSKILLNTVPVDWASEMDAAALAPPVYDPQWDAAVAAARLVSAGDLASLKDNADCGAVKVRVKGSQPAYAQFVRPFGLTDDFKAGVPRTAYRGVVPFRWGACQVYVTFDSDTYKRLPGQQQ